MERRRAHLFSVMRSTRSDVKHKKRCDKDWKLHSFSSNRPCGIGPSISIAIADEIRNKEVNSMREKSGGGGAEERNEIDSA